jgi:AcrR family transcriptional regulator
VARAERTRARNPRGSGDQLRADLLAAADEVLDTTGDPARVTVRGLAAAVGVAPNAVYLHFDDRDGLLAELAIDRFRVCTTQVRAAVEDIQDPLERLIAGHVEYCRLALERPGHYRLLFHGVVRPENPDVARRLAAAGLDYFQVCIDGCDACLTAGVLEAPSADALAASIWALQHGWCELAIVGMGVRSMVEPRELLELMLSAGSR